MPTPWIPESLVVVPKPVAIGGLIVLGLQGVKQFRQGHIGRVEIVASVFLLSQIVVPNWSVAPTIIQWLTNIGVPVAVIAGLSYLFKESLPTEFYELAYLLFGSLTILVVAFIMM